MSIFKCISLWQPWASLMLIPDPYHPLGSEAHLHRGETYYSRAVKSFETRSWSTPHRGILLIHAAKRWTPEEQDLCLLEPFRSALREGGFLRAGDLPRGAIVGYVDLVEIHTTHRALQMVPPNARELLFGNYAPRRFAWECMHPRRYDKPIPWRGAQGLFGVDSAAFNAARFGTAARSTI